TLARALSLEPEILCLDEFSIAIDPVTTMKIEDVLVQLKEKMTIILVTNLIQQAQRISDDMMFLNDSDIVELGPTAEMFANPKHNLTKKYLAGEMG
ncbi:phosphate ABC transporter ATP-binding protein, partial [Akkermansiaceae bacterium]|nr:phosphate ABC transporter ATP-binding protein [Akkermansiaceae bacterium]